MSETREALEGAARTLEVLGVYEGPMHENARILARQDAERLREVLATLSDERGEERERCAKIVEAHICTPWRTDGVTGWRDDKAADAGNEIIKRLASAIRAGGDNGH